MVVVVIVTHTFGDNINNILLANDPTMPLEFKWLIVPSIYLHKTITIQCEIQSHSMIHLTVFHTDVEVISPPMPPGVTGGTLGWGGSTS